MKKNVSHKKGKKKNLKEIDEIENKEKEWINCEMKEINR